MSKCHARNVRPGTELMGCLTRDIARRIHHDPSSVDAYQRDFERVYQLYRDGKDSNQISFLTKLSRQLVQEYIGLIKEYVVEQKKSPGRPALKKRRTRTKKHYEKD